MNGTSALSADVWTFSWMTEIGRCRLNLYCVLFKNLELWGKSQDGSLMEQRQACDYNQPHLSISEEKGGMGSHVGALTQHMACACVCMWYG